MLTHAAIILAAGAVVWLAGTRLSREAEALAAATGLGRVFIGAVLLGVATSLPELATTVTAGVVGNAQLAIGNLLGGVSLQVVVLAGADAVMSKRGLMTRVTRPMLLVQHVALIILLAVTVAAVAVGEPFAVVGIGVWPVVLAAIFAGSLWLVRVYEGQIRWAVVPEARYAPGGARAQPVGDAPAEGGEAGVERPPVWRLALLAMVILGAGWAVARSGDALGQQGPLSGTFIGAVLVALTTSLPEVSTVLGSLRSGSYDMAVSNIVGTNGLEVALLLVADVAYREGPVLSQATPSHSFLAALALVLVSIYLGALLLRREGTILRLGYGSAAVVLVYVAGIGVLATLG